MNDFLLHKAYALRVGSIRATTAAGSGHPTSCLSAADLVAAIFFYAMRYNLSDPYHPDNDECIFSKGHAAPLLYAAWWQSGVLTEQELLTLRQFGSPLEGHPSPLFPYVKVATGSLGCGLSAALGMILASRLDQNNSYCYVLLGDGECAEGSVWEAVELAAHYQADNLVAIVDCNGLGQTGDTLDKHYATKLIKKFEAFGWRALEIDGHDMDAIVSALDWAKTDSSQPTVLVARTIKGYGIHTVENAIGHHGKIFKPEQIDDVLKELKDRFDHYKNNDEVNHIENINEQSQKIENISIKNPSFYTSVATRKSYGAGLVAIGSVSKLVVALDGDVANSTFANMFEIAFPERFFQCFVAEQNMISMASGFAARGYIPFISTFAAFITRAHDQIRMAAIGRLPLRCVGSHAGLSIGEDGPSQMGLEDIALMRSIPHSVILYPSDAVSCYKLMVCMVNYISGISYLRTTREDTPILYNNDDETFCIGGCKVLRKNDQSRAVLVAAGVTVHEAIKAADLLEKDNIFVSIIDAYSVKPLDVDTIKDIAHHSNNCIITIEDHYIEGGLGEAVASSFSNSDIKVHKLAVRDIPGSGRPEQLRAWAGIDAHAIVKMIKSI